MCYVFLVPQMENNQPSLRTSSHDRPPSDTDAPPNGRFRFLLPPSVPRPSRRPSPAAGACHESGEVYLDNLMCKQGTAEGRAYYMYPPLADDYYVNKAHRMCLPGALAAGTVTRNKTRPPSARHTSPLVTVYTDRPLTVSRPGLAVLVG